MNRKSRVADAHAAPPKMLSRTDVPAAPRRSWCRERWQSQRPRQEPTERPKQRRSSSWPALHMRDPDNTIVDRNRLRRLANEPAPSVLQITIRVIRGRGCIRWLGRVGGSVSSTASQIQRTSASESVSSCPSATPRRGSAAWTLPGGESRCRVGGNGVTGRREICCPHWVYRISSSNITTRSV